jgi:hypothetical protein
MVSFDTNILVYATLSPFRLPLQKHTGRAISWYVEFGRVVHLTAVNARGVQQRGNSQGGHRGPMGRAGQQRI